MQFKTVIIEDEFHSLERLKSLLDDFEEIQIIGEAKDGQTAIKIIEQLINYFVFDLNIKSNILKYLFMLG